MVDIDKRLKDLKHERVKTTDLISKLEKQLKDIDNKMSTLEKNLPQYKKLCKRYLKLQAKIEKEWKEYESNYKDWKPYEMVAWLAYTLNKNSKYLDFTANSIDWRVIQNNLHQRQLKGKFFLICDESELKKLGINQKSVKKYLCKVIKQLTEHNEKHKQGDNNDNNCCCICYDSAINTVILPCKHACLCNKCVAVYRRTSDQCPLCRGKINDVINFFAA